jgi:hypothetical protein
MKKRQKLLSDVHGRRAHAKVSLHVGFGWRPIIYLAVVVNKPKILTLFVCEGFCGHKGSVLVSTLT